MRTLLILAAAALLAPNAPALAQSSSPYHPTHARHARHHAHAGFQQRARYDDASRYGSDDVYVQQNRVPPYHAYVPDFAWRPSSQTEGVGADLVGPGFSADNPTDMHDVSR